MELSSRVLFDWLSDWAVAGSLRADPEVLRRAKRVAVLDVAFLFWTVVFAGVYAAVGSSQSGLLTLGCVPFIGVSLLSLRLGKAPAVGGNLLCLGGCATLAALATINGGSAAPALLWLSCVPVVAVMTCGTGWGVTWLLTTLATVASFLLAEALGVSFSSDLSASQLSYFYYAAFLGLLASQFVLAWVRVGVEQRALDALHETQRRLAQARSDLDSLQRGFGFSIAEFTKLQREKKALELALSYKVDAVTEQEDEEADEDDDLDDDFAEFLAWDAVRVEAAARASAPETD